MAYTRPTFEVQGVTFKLKPTSPRNVMELMNYLDESEIEVEEDEQQVLRPLAEQYLEVLQLIADPVEGDIEEVEALDLDINKIDYYLQDFMPVTNET